MKSYILSVMTLIALVAMASQAQAYSRHSVFSIQPGIVLEAEGISPAEAQATGTAAAAQQQAAAEANAALDANALGNLSPAAGGNTAPVKSKVKNNAKVIKVIH